jgi:hypothetical protein
MAKTRPNRIHDIIRISNQIVNANLSGEAQRTAATIIYTTDAARIQNAFQYQQLCDSMGSSTYTDSLIKSPRLLFKEYNVDSLKPGNYVINYLNGRLNRAKITYAEKTPGSNKTLEFTRLYRDTGISGVMELYRIITNSNR